MKRGKSGENPLLIPETALLEQALMTWITHIDTNIKSSAQVPWFSLLTFHFLIYLCHWKMVQYLTWIYTADRPNNWRIYMLAYLQKCFWALMIHCNGLHFPFSLTEFYCHVQNLKHDAQSVPHCGVSHVQKTIPYTPFIYSPVPVLLH